MPDYLVQLSDFPNPSEAKRFAGAQQKTYRKCGLCRNGFLDWAEPVRRVEVGKRVVSRV
jgi:hypothetical protein